MGRRPHQTLNSEEYSLPSSLQEKKRKKKRGSLLTFYEDTFIADNPQGLRFLLSGKK